MQAQVHVNLDPSCVPVLDGVLECISRGVRSSLYEQNARVAAAVADVEAALHHPLWPLLLDPQTCE